jgi:hypothetical protein
VSSDNARGSGPRDAVVPWLDATPDTPGRRVPVHPIENGAQLKRSAIFLAFAAVGLVASLVGSTGASLANAGANRFSTVPAHAAFTSPGGHDNPLLTGPNSNVANKNGAQSETAVAVDPTNSKHQLTFSNDLASTSTIYESFDRGLKVNDDTVNAYHFHNAISVSPNGTVGILFYDTRNDPTSKKTDQYISFSSDCGVTWSANQKITTAMSDESGAGDPNDYGDYQGLAATPKNFFQAVWTDSRAGNKAEDMYSASAKK